jgi:hypothetical protein
MFFGQSFSAGMIESFLDFNLLALIEEEEWKS